MPPKPAAACKHNCRREASGVRSSCRLGRRHKATKQLPFGRDTFGTGGDTFRTSRDIFGTSRDTFGTSRDIFGTSRDTFGTGRDTFRTSRDTFGTSRDTFGPHSCKQEDGIREHDLLEVDIDRVYFLQCTCSQKFKDRRYVKQLIQDLETGAIDLLQHPDMILNVAAADIRHPDDPGQRHPLRTKIY